jgi:hypothetical protein
MANLLDTPMTVYLISPHGKTAPPPNDTNTFTVPKNMHIIGQGFRRDTWFYHRPEPQYAHQKSFSGIRHVWQNNVNPKYSMNEIIDRILPDTYIGTQYGGRTLDDLAYYPPGCNIRNLQLSRDYNSYNIDGIFKIGTRQPAALYNIMPAPAGVYQAPDNYSNLPKKYDPAYVGADKIVVPGLGYIARNDLNSCIQFIKTNESEFEQIVVLVLACASEHGYILPVYSEHEGTIVPGNRHNTIYTSNSDNDRITKVFFNNPHFRAEINYMFQNNIFINEALHPIISAPLANGLALYRSKMAFNSLVRRINNPTTYLILRNNLITQVNDAGLAAEIASGIPFRSFKVPKNYNRYFFTPSNGIIQFFCAFNPDIHEPGRPIPFPEKYDGVIEITNYPLPAGVPAPDAAPAPVGEALVNNDMYGGYYKKYLKYKSKYLQLKNKI